MSQVLVVASGYFDPIHVGHIEYLEKAKALGDKLIVIVNNDFSLMNKKGYVFMNENERCKVVKALRCVDEVVLQKYGKPDVVMELERIRYLYPFAHMVFAKGGDRYSHEIPEYDVCEMHGIKIIDGLGAKIQSSSELVKNIREYEEEYKIEVSD